MVYSNICGLIYDDRITLTYCRRQVIHWTSRRECGSLIISDEDTHKRCSEFTGAQAKGDKKQQLMKGGRPRFWPHIC